MASRPLPATPAPQPIYEEIDMDEAAPLEPPRDLGAVARRAAEHVVDRLEIFEHSHVLRSLRERMSQLESERASIVEQLHRRISQLECELEVAHDSFQALKDRLDSLENDAVEDLTTRLTALEDRTIPPLARRLELVAGTKLPAVLERVRHLEKADQNRTQADAQRCSDQLSVENRLQNLQHQVDEQRLHQNTDKYLFGILGLLCAVMLAFISKL